VADRWLVVLLPPSPVPLKGTRIRTWNRSLACTSTLLLDRLQACSEPARSVG